MKQLQCKEVEAYEASALGLQGTKGMYLRILSDDSSWIELEPGGYTPIDHKHEDKERIVVITGKGIIKLEDKQKEIKPSDFIEVHNEYHQLVNTGNEPFIFVCFRNQK